LCVAKGLEHEIWKPGRRPAPTLKLENSPVAHHISPSIIVMHANNLFKIAGCSSVLATPSPRTSKIYMPITKPEETFYSPCLELQQSKALILYARLVKDILDHVVNSSWRKTVKANAKYDNPNKPVEYGDPGSVALVRLLCSKEGQQLQDCEQDEDDWLPRADKFPEVGKVEHCVVVVLAEDHTISHDNQKRSQQICPVEDPADTENAKGGRHNYLVRCLKRISTFAYICPPKMLAQAKGGAAPSKDPHSRPHLVTCWLQLECISLAILEKEVELRC
jgi:hypothetical protein